MHKTPITKPHLVSHEAKPFYDSWICVKPGVVGVHTAPFPGHRHCGFAFWTIRSWRLVALSQGLLLAPELTESHDRSEVLTNYVMGMCQFWWPLTRRTLRADGLEP